jgi:hAT family C-terminal dimerisation region/Domain of unknown function (DUF4413)
MQLLSPFDQCTETFGGDQYVTGSIGVSTMDELRTHLVEPMVEINDNLDLSHDDNARIHDLIRRVASTMLSKLDKYMEHIWNEFTYIQCILDPRIKRGLMPEQLINHDNATKWHESFLEKLDEYNLQNNPASNTAESTRYVTTWERRMEAKRRAKHPGIRTEVISYLGIGTASFTGKLPLDWWRENAHDFPHLAAMARDYLCVPATSVPSERLFSAAGHTVSKQRTRLSSTSVRSLCCLNSWLKNGCNVLETLKQEILRDADQEKSLFDEHDDESEVEFESDEDDNVDYENGKNRD